MNTMFLFPFFDFSILCLGENLSGNILKLVIIHFLFLYKEDSAY